MNKLIDSISSNPGIYILIISIASFAFAVLKWWPKRFRLIIKSNHKMEGLNPTLFIRNEDPSDRLWQPNSLVSRELLTKIELQIRNPSQKTAFNVKIEKLGNGIEILKNFPKNCALEPDREIQITLRYTKNLVGKSKDLGNPRYMEKIDVQDDLIKLNPLLVISFENSKGKSFKKIFNA